MVEFSIFYANQRVTDLQREWEQFRLAAFARAGQQRRGMAAFILAGAGRRLATFGTRLHQRYSSIPAEANPASRIDHTIHAPVGR